jgi:PAS domain S-box-containing protein
VEHSVEAILFVQDRRVVYANPAAAELFGVRTQDLVGEWILRLGHPEERADLLKNPSFTNPTGGQLETRVLCPPAPLSRSVQVPEGSVAKWVRASTVSIDWENAPAVMIFMQDISLERESKDQLLRALQQERELGQLRTRFVSMASHEFRTPLATIQTSTELLQHYSERLSSQEREEAVADILGSVGRMQAMIDNFLTLGRMQADAMRCEPRSLCVFDVLQSLSQECANADNHRHLVMLDIDPAVPTTERLMLDEMLLRLIVGNLLGNACKYSPVGSTVWLRIGKASAHPHTPMQSQLKLTISDEGIGIPKEDLPRLFEPFHRASNTGEVRGTGVGLAIVRRASQSHGGDVSLQTVQGKGSTFTVLLPWTEPSAGSQPSTEVALL